MTFPEITTQDQQRYREELDTIVVRESNYAKAGGSTASKALHIPDEEGNPVCQTDKKLDSRAWTEKSIKVYPPGHKEICQRCIAQDSEMHQFQQYTREECKQALAETQAKVDGTLSKEKYRDYRDKDQPGPTTLATYFGSWGEAKDKLL